jgi:DNA replication protein DnaC
MPNPACQCGGTGWLYALRDGKSGVLRCPCVLERQTTYIYEKASIPPRYAHCALDNFRAENDVLKVAQEEAARFVADYAAGLAPKGLLFVGPCGTGKTHLAAAILREAIARHGARGVFCDFRELLARLQFSFDSRTESSEEILKPVLEAKLLVLDDLGRERDSEWTQDTAGMILAHRYNASLPTVITTNLALESSIDDPGAADDIESRLGVRIASRLREMCRVVQFGGRDFRDSRAEQIMEQAG